MLGTLKRYVVSQFGNPRGLPGRLAGFAMDKRPSNRRRNLWTLGLIEPVAGDRILEIGYGPGFAIEALLERHEGVHVTGIDRSRTMHAKARARNRAAIRDNRLTLVTGSIEELEPWTLGGPFSKAYSVNSVMFWRDPAAVFRLLGARMTDDGQVFITYQPRVGPLTEEAALAKAAEVEAAMRDAGYAGTRIEVFREVSPVAVCVIGRV